MRKPIPRIRIVAATLGTLLGVVCAVIGFRSLGWYSLLLIPVGSSIFLIGRGSLEDADRVTEKKVTVHLSLHPEDDDDRGGAA